MSTQILCHFLLNCQVSGLNPVSLSRSIPQEDPTNGNGENNNRLRSRAVGFQGKCWGIDLVALTSYLEMFVQKPTKV